MKVTQQSDGSWVTSPIYTFCITLPSQNPCEEDKHTWVTRHTQDCPLQEDMPGAKHMHFQECSVCGWQRVHITKE